MDNVIKIENMDKVYKMYATPTDRLKEALHPFKKKYSHSHYALRNINLEIGKGESIGLLGTNGSGKSTLLKIITGVLTPTSGSLEVNGKISALLELGAGFNPEYTGIQNIYLNGSMMGYSEDEMKQKIDSIIDFADIGDFIYQPVKTYSSGMFARLAFSVAISVEPEILIVDETLSVGDSKFQIKCIEKMEQIKSKGTTILFVSHAIEQIRRFCDRAVWIEKGEQKAVGPVNEICDLYENFLVYGDRAEVSQSNEELSIPESPSVLGRIVNVRINKEKLKTFEKLCVEVEYEIYTNEIEDFLLGVAFYTPNRDYIFGPNTYLDKVEVPNKMGRHKVDYVIERIPLLNGIYQIEVGIFSKNSLVCIDYKGEIKGFTVGNDYIAEGTFYIDHRWEIKQ